MKRLINLVRGVDTLMYRSRDFILFIMPWFCIGLMVFLVIFHCFTHLINLFL